LQNTAARIDHDPSLPSRGLSDLLRGGVKQAAPLIAVDGLSRDFAIHSLCELAFLIV
jgi:hypothetical protein